MCTHTLNINPIDTNDELDPHPQNIPPTQLTLSKSINYINQIDAERISPALNRHVSSKN